MLSIKCGSYPNVYVIIFSFQILQTLSRVLCAISHSGNMVIYCISSSSFRMVLCNGLLCRKEYALDQSIAQSPFERNNTVPTDTVCMSIIQGNRHHSTGFQMNNALSAVHMAPFRKDPDSIVNNRSNSNSTFVFHRVNKNHPSTQIDESNHGDFELQASARNT